MKKKARIMLVMYLLLFVSTFSVANANTKEEMNTGYTETYLKEIIDKYAQKYIGESTVGAAIAVIENDKTIFEDYYGYADLLEEKTMTKDAVFEWGSTTKILVWVSVMQLVEQGKLDLDKDINTYLPNGFLTKLNDEEPITMLHLMNHNAGWEEHLTDLFYHDPNKVRSLSETLKMSEPSQRYQPGEIVSYSNFGTALAAYIVECIAEKEFFEYVNDNIFSVLKMNETSIHPLQLDNDDIRNRRSSVKGYAQVRGGFVEKPLLYLSLYPAGGAVGTLPDMVKFVSALLPKEGSASPLFKNQNTLAQLFTTSYGVTNDFPGIAHGFWEHFYSFRVLEHAGNTDSFSSQIVFSPENGIALIVATNQAYEKMMTQGLKDRIFQKYEYRNDDVLPDATIVTGMYRSVRRPHSGFSQWLNFIVSEVQVIDENTIEIDENKYIQIRPYVFQYTGDYGASELIYFNVENDEVKNLYIKYGHWEVVNTSTTIYTLGCIILFVLCSLYFLISFIIFFIKFLRKKEKRISLRPNLLLSAFGFFVALNTGVLFSKAISLPSYADLKIHFLFNILYVLFLGFMFGKTAIARLKNKIRLNGSTIVMYAVSIIYSLLILVCELYK